MATEPDFEQIAAERAEHFTPTVEQMEQRYQQAMAGEDR